MKKEPIKKLRVRDLSSVEDRTGARDTIRVLVGGRVVFGPWLEVERNEGRLGTWCGRLFWNGYWNVVDFALVRERSD